MASLEVFTVRDLTNRPEDILRHAEGGQMSLIIQEDRPVILTVPFNERLIELGVHRNIAIHLFESGQVTLGRAAKIAGLSIGDFLDVLGPLGIPVVDYPPEELEKELEAARGSDITPPPSK